MCHPQGQVAYLSRLRCADGSAPTFERRGQRGYRNPRSGDADYRRSAEQVSSGRPLAAGEVDLHPVDLYTLTCPGHDAARELYLDMYHCSDGGQTATAPSGFSLAAAEK